MMSANLPREIHQLQRSIYVLYDYGSMRRIDFNDLLLHPVVRMRPYIYIYIYIYIYLFIYMRVCVCVCVYSTAACLEYGVRVHA